MTDYYTKQLRSNFLQVSGSKRGSNRCISKMCCKLDTASPLNALHSLAHTESRHGPTNSPVMELIHLLVRFDLIFHLSPY